MGKKGKRSNKAAGGGDKGKVSAGRARRERIAAMKEIETSIEALAKKFEEELKDVDVFCPLAAREDCAICFLPMPSDDRCIAYGSCCGKSVCHGCMVSHVRAIHGQDDASISVSCPFCRAAHIDEFHKDKPLPNVSHIERLRSRAEKINDPEAMMHLAKSYEYGEDGLEKDDVTSFRLTLKAAEAGEVRAIRHLAQDCFSGQRIKKNMHCARKLSTAAAKQGDHMSHYLLGKSYLSEREEKLANGEDKNPKSILMARHLAHAARGGNQYAMKTYQRLRDDGVVQEKECDEVEHAFLKSKTLEWSEQREYAESLCSRLDAIIARTHT